MKKILTVFAVILAIVIGLCGAYYKIAIVPQEKYNAAEEALVNGDYESALKGYKSAGNYEDAKDKLKAIETYQEAISLMENGELKKAIKKFKSIKDVINCADYIRLCKTYKKVNVNKKALVSKGKHKQDYDLNNEYAGYSDFRDSDLCVHIRSKISADKKVTVEAYADKKKKPNDKKFKKATYEANSKHCEWTVDSDDNSDIKEGYSYNFKTKQLKIRGYNKNNGKQSYKYIVYFTNNY